MTVMFYVQIFSIPLLTSYPFMSKLSGLKLFFVVNCASLLKSAISVSILLPHNTIWRDYNFVSKVGVTIFLC